MNIRQKNPEIALSNTVIAKTHFLDNVVGSANYTPDIASGTTTQWTSGLGKKFIDGRNEMGLAGIFETGMGISNNDVTFFASFIDEYRPGITLGRSQVKESKPDLGGKSQTDSLTAEMKRSWFKDRNFALQKQELSGSTFYIMDQKTLDPPTNISGLINLVISKSEYDAIAMPSNLDTTIHAPLLSFQNFGMESDNNQVPYRKAALKVNGAASSGTKITSGLGVDLLTFNYGMLNSEAAGNVVELEEAENGILLVDEFIEALKVVERVYQFKDPSLINICTRIRRQSYGPFNNSGSRPAFAINPLLGIVFDNSMPLSKAEEGFKDRYLSPELIGSDVYNLLSSHANENGIKDNPSPYLINNLYLIDLGQILYGFETIFYQPHYPPTSILSASKPDSSTYSPAYEIFPVHIINDLAGWIANVITPATDYFIFLQTGDSPNDPPLDPSLNAYYEYSAPDADLYGNADAIGIYKAYQVLLENPSNADILKLSDVFTLYYKGSSELRSEIVMPTSPSNPFFTFENRWKIFSLFFGFLAEDGSGGYIWVPDSTNLWSHVMAPYSASNPTGKDYDNRLFSFAEFWLTRRKSPFDTIYGLLNSEIIVEEYIDRFINEEGFDNPVEFAQYWINKTFVDKFLPWLKTLTL